MVKQPIKYSVVDAFTETAFKGNPAVVCMLEEDMDHQWLQTLAMEFNMPVTCYLTPSKSDPPHHHFINKFRLRWFSPTVEDSVCGSAHCALAQYWCNQLGKCDFVAYSASMRGGVVKVHVDEQEQRVLLRGKACTVMEGTLLL